MIKSVTLRVLGDFPVNRGLDALEVRKALFEKGIKVPVNVETVTPLARLNELRVKLDQLKTMGAGLNIDVKDKGGLLMLARYNEAITRLSDKATWLNKNP